MKYLYKDKITNKINNILRCIGPFPRKPQALVAYREIF